MTISTTTPPPSGYTTALTDLPILLNTLFPTSGLNPQRKILNQTFEYENVSGQRTTNLISSHYVGFNNSADQPLFTHSYSYDANGNISSLSRLANGQTSALSYQYDGLDQLIRVNDQEANKTVLYSYDASGMRLANYAPI